jgi:hypothetical protein
MNWCEILQEFCHRRQDCISQTWIKILTENQQNRSGPILLIHKKTNQHDLNFLKNQEFLVKKHSWNEKPDQFTAFIQILNFK